MQLTPYVMTYVMIQNYGVVSVVYALIARAQLQDGY